MPIQKITSGIIQDGAVAAADIVSVSNTAITGNIISSQITSVANTQLTGTITGSQISSNTLSNTVFQTGSVENYMNVAGLGFGMRNRIINGAIGIWQRGTSFTSGGSATYTADRFFGNASSGTISRSTDVPAGFTYSFSNAASSTAFPGIAQRIESVNIADCASQAITVSFYAKQTSGTASALNINLSYPTAVDNYSSSTSIIETTVVASMTASWTRYSYTYTLPANVTNGLSVTLFIPNASITATFLITGIQVEKGSTATSFDYRPYTTELSLAQRYYWSELGSLFASGIAFDTAEAHVRVQYPVPMRTSPTVTIYDNSNNAARIHRNRTGDHGSAVSVVNGTAQGFPTVSSSSLTAGGGYACKVKADAEL